MVRGCAGHWAKSSYRVVYGIRRHGIKTCRKQLSLHELLPEQLPTGTDSARVGTAAVTHTSPTLSPWHLLLLYRSSVGRTHTSRFPVLSVIFHGHCLQTTYIMPFASWVGARAARLVNQ